MKTRVQRLMVKVGNGLSYIAVWQILAFLLLILLTWVNEIIDLSALLFGAARRPMDVTRGCLATAGVLVAAVISVGNTYMQQKRLVRGLLTICSYCKKIRIESTVWQQIEEYIHKRSNDVEFTHGICPECLVRETDEVLSKPAGKN